MALTPEGLRDVFEFEGAGCWVGLDLRGGEKHPATITLDGTWQVQPLIEKLTALALGGNL